MDIDWGPSYFFGQLAREQPWLLGPAQLLDELGSYPVTVGVVALVAVIFALRRQPGHVALTLAVYALAVSLAEGTRTWIPRQRPDDAQDWPWIDASEMAHSYPARGVLLFTTAVLLLCWALPVWRRLPVVLAALLIVGVAVSQFLLKLHFLTDVLAGLAAGLACVLLARFGSQLSASRAGDDPVASNRAP